MKVEKQIEIIEYEGGSIDIEKMKKSRISSEFAHYISENFGIIKEVDRRPDQYRGDVVRYIYEVHVLTVSKHEEIMRLLQIMGADAKYKKDWPTLDNIGKLASLLND